MYIWRVYQEGASTRLDPICHFLAHNTYLTRLLVSPDNKSLATCSADHTVKIWRIDPDSPDLLTDEYRERLEAEEESAQNLGEIANTSSITNDISGVQATANSLSVTERSTLSNGNTSTYSVPGIPAQPILNAQRPLELITTLQGHQRWVWDCAFSADSAYLVTVCSDHYARLWELSSGTIIRQYNVHHRGAVCVALNDHSEVAA